MWTLPRVSVLQLKGDEERVVVVAWLFQSREREPACQRGTNQISRRQMVHTHPRADPLTKPGARTVPCR